MYLVVFHVPRVTLGQEAPGGVGNALRWHQSPYRPGAIQVMQVLEHSSCLAADGAGHDLLVDRVLPSTGTHGL